MEKTLRASIIGLTNRKKKLLDSDYEGYQWWMIFGVDKGILSCFKTHKWFKQKEITYKEYPLPLHSRFIKDWLRIRETKLTKHWIKIPNSKKKGMGVWLPLRFHQPLPTQYTIRDSCLVRKNNQYYLHLCVDVPEPSLYKPKTVMGIDLGLKNPITMVNLKNRETQFLGKELKQVKGKYFYLRKKLGKEKKLKQIKKMRHKERQKVESILHKLSKTIVLQAYEKKSALVIGELKNIEKNKGRRFNRKLSSFSYHKLTAYIQYKAKEKGVPVITVNEAYTSKTCHVCGMRGVRIKNWFACECGYEDNADRNAAFNIGQRGLSYMLRSGVAASAQKSIVMNGQAQEIQICDL